MTAQRVAAIVDRAGETVTLRRPGTPDVDVTVKASIRRYAGADLVGGIIQGTAEVILSNRELAAASWPGPPRIGDKIVRDGKVLHVESCETRNHKEETALHILRAVG